VSSRLLFNNDGRTKIARPPLTIFLPLLLLTALIAGDPQRRLWTALISSVVFAAMQWCLPQCRFRTEQYFSPVNMALLLMLLRLVVVPALIATVGAESPMLSQLPSMKSMEEALSITTVAFIAMGIGLSLTPPPPRQVKVRFLPSPSTAFVLAFAVIGAVGFFAQFGSVGRMIEFLTEPAAVTQVKEELDGSWAGAAGSFLRPFLAFSMIAWWTALVDRSRNWKIVTLAGLAVALGVTLANLTFSFNRAAFVFPLIVLASVYHRRIRRLPFVWIGALGAVALPGLIMLQSYRTNMIDGKEVTQEQLIEDAVEGFSMNIQAYAVGPQYTAVFYDRLGWGEHLYAGSTLIASALSPMPIVGKSFREGSGPILFNRAIYQVEDIVDQILPFDAELFANFHIPGVVGGYLLLGFLLGKSEHWIEAAGSTFTTYALQYGAMWGAMLASWSVSIYAQILIYFFGPVYLYICASHLREWLRRTAGPDPAPQWEAVR
jgi:hypothetical protein